MPQHWWSVSWVAGGRVIRKHFCSVIAHLHVHLTGVGETVELLVLRAAGRDARKVWVCFSAFFLGLDADHPFFVYFLFLSRCPFECFFHSVHFLLSLAALWLSMHLSRFYKYVPQLSIRRRTHQRNRAPTKSREWKMDIVMLYSTYNVPLRSIHRSKVSKTEKKKKKKMCAREAFNIFICLFSFGTRNGNGNGNGHSSSTHSDTHRSDQCRRNGRYELNWIGFSATSYILH